MAIESLNQSTARRSLRAALGPLALLLIAGSAPLIAEPALGALPGSPACLEPDQEPPQGVPGKRQLPDLSLELVLPAGVEWTERPGRFPEERLFLTGKFGGSSLFLSLIQFPDEVAEPDVAVRQVVDSYESVEERPVRYGEIAYRPGSFGAAPYAAWVRGERLAGTSVVGESTLFGGVVPAGAYVCEVDCEPPAKGELLAALQAFLDSGIRYTGKLRDPEWSKDEIEARIARDFPEKVREDRQQVVRTKHYIVLGNSSGAGAFGKEIEAHYESIQKVYPFPEVEGRKLMPVYLFRNRQDYIDFYVHITNGQVSAAQAAKSGGHAWRDYYATHYESPKDPTHIHELTHQIFANRLLLSGGGSWFQEGAAVFMESTYSPESEQKQLNFGRTAAKKGEYQPFREFMVTESLLYSNDGKNQKGASSAGQAYTQAGTILWFVMKEPDFKAKAQAWLHAVGSVQRGNLAAIEAATRGTLGIDLAQFEAQYLKFWKKPKR